jgi:hypothetical protein
MGVPGRGGASVGAAGALVAKADALLAEIARHLGHVDGGVLVASRYQLPFPDALEGAQHRLDRLIGDTDAGSVRDRVVSKAQNTRKQAVRRDGRTWDRGGRHEGPRHLVTRMVAGVATLSCVSREHQVPSDSGGFRWAWAPGTCLCPNEWRLPRAVGSPPPSSTLGRCSAFAASRASRDGRELLVLVGGRAALSPPFMFCVFTER